MMVVDFGGTAWQIDGVRNPSLTLCRGATYKLSINASGHPFVIQTADGLTYNDGVTGNGTTMGELVFVVPKNAPAVLRYICAMHPVMTGPIYVVD
jgi:hypothetical protein